MSNHDECTCDDCLTQFDSPVVGNLLQQGDPTDPDFTDRVSDDGVKRLMSTGRPPLFVINPDWAKQQQQQQQQYEI